MMCRILLLVILTSCVSGSFDANGEQTSYQAEENHNITLEWKFPSNPDSSIDTLNIICNQITDHKVSVLYRVRDGVEMSEVQDAKFSGRVHSDKNALREGRIRLELCRLRVDDSGLYLCEVNTGYGFSVGRYELNVNAPADHLHHVMPTLSAEDESRGNTTFFLVLGLTGAALFVVLPVAICLFVGMRKKQKNISEKISEKA